MANSNRNDHVIINYSLPFGFHLHPYNSVRKHKSWRQVCGLIRTYLAKMVSSRRTWTFTVLSLSFPENNCHHKNIKKIILEFCKNHAPTLCGTTHLVKATTNRSWAGEKADFSLCCHTFLLWSTMQKNTSYASEVGKKRNNDNNPVLLPEDF